ncbi:hypothetical protein GCM10018771_15290 [Streptomyces cellulosae]|nr:hypothetical protein GCM10018771_15290 [Streptomyces cellulosae]
MREDVLAEGGAEVAAAVLCRNGEVADAAVPAIGVDAPGHVTGEAVVGLGDRDVQVPLGGVELRYLATVVVTPVAVLVGEDGLADERAEGVLVERPERLDRQVGHGREVLRGERADAHGSVPFGLRAGRPGGKGASVGPLPAVTRRW